MSGMDKERYVYGVFQAIAGRYDAANRRISLGWHMRWKRVAMEDVVRAVPEGGNVLDVCCGTGDVSGLLLRLAPGLHVTGIDFSPNMLHKAREKLENNARVTLVKGNASELPFGDGVFDAAVISFALRNTGDYGRVLGEMVRVVRPGGVVCCMDSFRPTGKWVCPIYDFYFSRIMPFLGGGFRQHDKYRWLYESTRAFVTTEQMRALMLARGIRRITERRFMYGACVCECGYRDRGEKAYGKLQEHAGTCE